MKIAIFSDNFYPELSGITDSLISLGRELGKRNHKLHFYVPYYSRKDFEKSNIPPKEINLGENVGYTRYFSIPYPTATNQGRIVLPLIFRSLSVKRFNPDIIHTQDFFGAGIEALASAKIFHIPIIGTNHTPIGQFLDYFPIKAKWFGKLILKYVSWYYNQCDFVTAPTDLIFPEMMRYGFKKPHEAISNPIETDFFIPVVSSQKKEMKRIFGFSDKTVVYTGRLAKEKNIDVLIKAVALIKKEIPDVLLALTGHGANESELRNLARETKTEKNILFMGTMSRSQLVKFYQAADIFAIASTAETQCISMMQAMASGLPVVGVKYLGLAQYINTKNGFLIEPGDYKAMAKKIILLFKKPEIAQKLGRGGLNFVKNFSIHKIADKWENLYDKVIVNKK